MPASMLYGVARLMDSALRLTGRESRRFKDALDKVLGWACYDSAKISNELGYQPVWTLGQTVLELTMRKGK